MEASSEAQSVADPTDGPKKRSRSESSSSSSSSSSSRQSSKRVPESFVVGEQVEIIGLTSDTGKVLNGQKGILTEFNAEKERWEVTISLDKVVSLRTSNLRKVQTESRHAVEAAPKIRKTEGSLSSLLGLGKPKEDPKKQEDNISQQKPEWTSVWDRSSGEAKLAAENPTMSEEQIQYLQSFNQAAADVDRKVQKRANKVRRELAQQGILEEELVQEVIRQREEERKQLILFRGPAAVRDDSSSPSRSRSRSAGSSSSSSQPDKNHKAKE